MKSTIEMIPCIDDYSLDKLSMARVLLEDIVMYGTAYDIQREMQLIARQKTMEEIYVNEQFASLRKHIE